MFVEPTRVTTSYFAEIRDFPPLSSEEERRLISLAQDGDISARDVIVQSQLKFVVAVAKHMGFQECFNDMISEGNIGVIEAIYNFDVNCDNRFSSYCIHWIRKKMTEYLTMHYKTVRLKSACKVNRLLKAYGKMFFDEYGYEPLDSELIEYMQEHGESVTDDQPLHVSSTSITPNDDESGEEYTYDFNAATSSCNINEYINDIDRKESVDRFFSLCTDKEKDVIKKLYGIGCEKMTIKAVSEVTGVNIYRVENAVKGVIKRAKKAAKKRDRRFRRK